MHSRQLEGKNCHTPFSIGVEDGNPCPLDLEKRIVGIGFRPANILLSGRPDCLVTHWETERLISLFFLLGVCAVGH